MYPYLIIFTSSAVLAYLLRARAHSRAVAVVFGVFLLFFAGTRVNVGCDYNAYLDRFTYSFQGMGWLEAFEMGEGGFHILNFTLRDWGYSFSALIFVCALIYVACLGRFSSLAQRPLSFLALSFPILVVQLGMSGLRQALATGFLMLALKAFVDKRRLLVGVWIVVASQFHTSAIIFLPIVFLVGRKVSALRLVLAMVLLGPVVMFLLQERLDVYSARYVEQIYGENSSGGAWLRYGLVLIPFLLFEWKRRLVEARYPQLFELMRLFAFISFALLPIGLLSSVALHRLVFYAMPVSILTLLCVCDCVFDRRSARVGAAIPFFYYGAYIATWFVASRHAASCYIPYQSWLM